MNPSEGEAMHPEPTELHRQGASMFLCWPTNAIDLAKNDSDLPELIEKLARFAAAWEQNGRASVGNPLSAEMREAIAQKLWHRFAPTHHLTWDNESHKAEYLDAADAVLAVTRPHSHTPETK